MTTELKCQHCQKLIGFAGEAGTTAWIICADCFRPAHRALLESQNCYEKDALAAPEFEQGELAAAGATYALFNVETKPFKPFWKTFWPFEPERFVPTRSRSRNVVVALSYLVAELNRIEAAGIAKPCVCTPESVCPYCQQNPITA